MVLWDKVFYEVAKEYEGVVEHDKMLVDAMTVRMVNAPESLDVIVATNRESFRSCIWSFRWRAAFLSSLRADFSFAVHADILSDLAAALAGSIGIAPSSNLDPSRQYPSMFEPIHGSAPDIAGKGIANPVGAFWSAAEMVRWVGAGKLDAQADALMQAIENVTGAGIKTKDLGGDKGTEEVTQAVVEEIERLVKKN
jgi:isocitrate/isopropylmalate dehydrogenase